MNKKITVVKALANFYAGKYDVNDLKTQIKAGWYDWFCKDDLLGTKTGKLYKKLNQIIDSKKFDKDNTYVFFKQICTCSALMDSFSICDIKTGKVLYNVIPCPTRNYYAEVYGKDNNFNSALVSGTWNDIKNFFMNEVK